ncbi:MAG: hypothetical protein O2999_09375 [Nitrospirae bacterium]|nr:hypothetical protein [Nitrospirota bacterium]MDA1304493.1 hypothetical protein [Nitrospirota bacterium]
MPSLALTKFLLLPVLLTVFLVGCVKSPSPEVGLLELRAQAEARLLEDAKLAFVRSDYPEAVLLLNRFVKTHRHSKWVPEAEWWLARSYEQSGNLRLALGRFQRLAHSSTNHPYRHEASLRAQTLIETLGIEALPSTTNGVSVALHDLQGGSEISSLMSHIRHTRGGVVLINLGCPVPPTPDGAMDEADNTQADWGNRLGRGLGPLIDDAYQMGQAVYLGVSLPCLGMFAQESEEDLAEWHDWSFEPQSQRVRRSSYFSLFSLEYQTALLDMLSKLSRFKIAGMVFQEDAPLGPYEGLSPIAMKRFAEAFDAQLHPASLFLRGNPVRTPQRGPEEIQEILMDTYPDVFWKWAGWKSRERLRVMNELMQSVREQFPHLQFGVEIHQESLHAPVYALANFSEDWVEMAHAPFDFFVTRVSNTASSGMYLNLPNTSQSNPRSFDHDLIQRMVKFLDEPQKVWVIVPAQEPRVGFGMVLNEQQVKKNDWPEGVGELHDFFPVP